MNEQSGMPSIPTLHVSDHPLIKHKKMLLSDVNTDTKTFRELARELTTLLIYEATQDLPTTRLPYRTPLIHKGVGFVVRMREDARITPPKITGRQHSVAKNGSFWSAPNKVAHW